MELWVGCVAGALSDDEYAAKLAGAGFENVGIEPTRVLHAAGTNPGKRVRERSNESYRWIGKGSEAGTR